MTELLLVIVFLIVFFLANKWIVKVQKTEHNFDEWR